MTKREKSTFVLDTNVLIHRPDAILSFKESEIVIPLWVLEELDKLKSDHAERGRNARAAIRYLDELCQDDNRNMLCCVLWLIQKT